MKEKDVGEISRRDKKKKIYAHVAEFTEVNAFIFASPIYCLSLKVTSGLGGSLCGVSSILTVDLVFLQRAELQCCEDLSLF